MTQCLPYRRQSKKGPKKKSYSIARVMGSRGGFTLLETLVALVILTIGIVSVLHVFQTSLHATTEAESYSTAAMLANEIASNLDSQASVTAGTQTGTFDDASNYTYETEVASPDDNGLMRTQITVSWMAGNNPRQYEMVIYLKSSSTPAVPGV